MFNVIVFIFLFFISLHAEQECVINNDLSYKDCADSISIFYDTQNIYSSATPPPINLFMPIQKTSLGYQLKPVWTKLVLRNSSQITQEILLVNPRVGMDKIEALVYKHGKLIQHDFVGDMVPISTKHFVHRYSIIHLSIPPNEQVTIISQIHNYAINETSWVAVSYPLFQKFNEYDMLIWGIFYGLTIAILLYNINTYIILRNKVFILYVLIAIGTTLQLTSFNGIGYEFSPFLTLNNSLVWIFVPLTILFMLLFSKYFFNTQSTMPTINKIITFFIVLIPIIALIFIIGFFYFQHSETMFQIKKYLVFSSIIYLVPVIIGVTAIKQKLKGSVYYLIGQGAYSVSICYQVLYSYSGSLFSFTTLYSTLLGSLIDLIFLTFALGEFFRYIKYKKERNEKLLIAQSSFSSIGKSIGHITHQWRHPIANIGSSLTLLESVYRHQNSQFKDTFEKSLPNLNRYIKNLENILDDFSSFYMQQNENINFSPIECINNTKHLLESKIILKNITITVNTPNDMILNGHKNIISNIILNLIDNSIDAFKETQTENTISITFSKTDTKTEILYEDNAGGIKIQPIYKIFEYHITTKEDNLAHGFGLPMVKLLIEDRLNGQIRVENTSTGALFSIRIPHKSKG